MKAQFLLISCVLFSVFCFGTKVQFGAGYDFNGNHKIKETLDGYTFSNNYDISNAIAPYIELMREGENTLLGFGVEYQPLRDISFHNYGEKGKVGFIPFYGVFRYQVPIRNYLNPELIGQLGYNFINADKDYADDARIYGGLYFGAGAGLAFDCLTTQILYKSNYGSMRQNGYYNGSERDTKINETQINVAIGFRF